MDSAESWKGWYWGGTLRKLEWDDARKRSQHTRQGENMQTDNEWTGSERNRRGTSDQDSVTEHQVGEVRRAGGGIPGATAGECGCGFCIYTKNGV